MCVDLYYFAKKNKNMEQDKQLLFEKNSIMPLTELDLDVFDHIKNLQRGPIKSEAYVALLCTEGRAECRLEGNKFVVGKNDLFLSHPNQFIDNTMISFDFKCCGMVMSPEFFDNIVLLSNNIWEAKMAIGKNPVLHLEEQVAEDFVQSCIFLKRRLMPPFGKHHKEMVELLIQSMVYGFYDSIIEKLDISQTNYSSAENLFGKFLQLAEANVPRQREVKFYAEKLCVTPKYLSAVCKQSSGKTASAMIDQLVAKQLKRMLLLSDKSIKEIAFEAGFDNLSFFGKYVKRTLGSSPRDFRQQGF